MYLKNRTYVLEKWYIYVVVTLGRLYDPLGYICWSSQEYKGTGTSVGP